MTLKPTLPLTGFLLLFVCCNILFGQASLGRKQSKIVVLSFRLTHNRLVPSQIEASKGRYIIRLNNGVFGGPISFDVVRSSGGEFRLGGKALRQGSGREQIDLELTPGEYQVRVGTTPPRTALITVTR